MAGGGEEGRGEGGSHIGCRLKFHYFVGCRLSVFDLCRLSVNPS